MTDIFEEKLKNDIEQKVRDEWDAYVREQDAKIAELKTALKETCELARSLPHLSTRRSKAASDAVVRMMARVTELRKLADL